MTMDFRRMRLFSWSNGYGLGDCVSSAYRKLVARRVRKQEGRKLRKELVDAFEASCKRNMAAYRYLEDRPKP